MLKFLRTDSSNEDFIELVRLLDADLKIRDGDDHEFYHQFNKIVAIKQALVLYEDGVAVACGAIKPFDENSAEVKRMYVRETRRRMGFASAVLGELEKWALELGYARIYLETGRNQPEAIQLYHKSGYEVVENYGQYKGVGNSICFSKKISI